MYTTILTYGRHGVLPVFLVAASVVVTASCGGGAALSSSESLASALPTEPTSLPLQPNAPDVGGDVQAPLQDVARLQLTEAQVMEMTDACRETSEIVAGSECTTAIQVNTRNASPCAAKDLCATVAEWLESGTERAPGWTLPSSRWPTGQSAGSGRFHRALLLIPGAAPPRTTVGCTSAARHALPISPPPHYHDDHG